MKAPKLDDNFSFDLAENNEQKKDNLDSNSTESGSSDDSLPEPPPTRTSPYDIHKVHTLEATPLNLAQQISNDLESSFKASPTYNKVDPVPSYNPASSSINYTPTKQPADLTGSNENISQENSGMMPSSLQGPLSEMGESSFNQDTLSSLAAQLKESFGINKDRAKKIRLIVLASILVLLLIVCFVILPSEPSFVSTNIDQVDASKTPTDSSLITEDHSLANPNLDLGSQKEGSGFSSIIQGKLSDVVDLVKGVISAGSQDPNSMYPPGTTITTKKTTKTTTKTTTPVGDQNPLQAGSQVVGGSSNNGVIADLASRINTLKSMLIDAIDGWNKIKTQRADQWTDTDEEKLTDLNNTLNEIETAAPNEAKVKELEDKVGKVQQELLALSVSANPAETAPSVDVLNQNLPQPEPEPETQPTRKRIYETPMVARTPYTRDLPQDQPRTSGQIPENPYWFLPNKNFDTSPIENSLSPEQEDEYLQRLASPFNYQRYQAILDLKRLKLKGTEPLFEKELSEDKLWLRMNSLMAMADIGVYLNVDSVENALKQERSDLVSGFFKRYASREYVTDGELVVLRYAIRVTDKYSRFNILRALRRWDPNLADLYFTAASYDPDSRIQKYAKAYLKKHPLDEETKSFYLEIITGTTDVDFAYDSDTSSEISSLEVN